MASGHVQFKGGKKLEKLLREAGKRGVKQVEVGFFESAKYEDGTPVAAVAAIHEFGAPSKNIPERPFFRQAVTQMQDGVATIVRSGIDAEKMVVDDQLADRVGEYAAAEVKESITQLRQPGLAASTKRARVARHGKKRGSGANPLVDTGFMRASTGWSVDSGPVKHPREGV